MGVVSWVFGLALVLQAVAAEVVVLTSQDFEHKTQASTGATTGDWFIGETYRFWLYMS